MSNPRNVHRPTCPAPHRTAESSGYGDTRGESRAHPGGETWRMVMCRCLRDRYREGFREASREGYLPWGSVQGGTPPTAAPIGGHSAAWRDEMPYDSLGLRPPLSSAATLTAAGVMAVPSSAVAADEVYGCNSPAKKPGLSRKNTLGRLSDGVECGGPRQRYCSRGSTRPFGGEERERRISKAS